MYNYITTLNNFFYAYDKYSKTYSKKNIPQSTYPDEFYLIKENDLKIGLLKAIKLLSKLNLPDNLILRIETDPIANGEEVFKNERNGLGYFIKNNAIRISKLFISSSTDINKIPVWKEISCENAYALSLKINNLNTHKYESIRPLSFSFLPIGIACQAKCKFCFSHSSISSEQIKKLSDYSDITKWMDYSVERGAKRFVITGGGDPGVWGLNNLINVISIAKPKFNKTILFSNGIFLEKNKTDAEIQSSIKLLKNSGLDTLSLSIHHYNTNTNTFIMGIDTKYERLLSLISDLPVSEKPTIRLICVLQKNGIDSKDEIKKYIDFASKHNIGEVCFKELYVSSGTESIYSTLESNIYSEINQISLSVVLDYAKECNLEAVSKLPWGSPIFEFNVNGKIVKVAAYTEPSLGWETTAGIARSWNYLSDHKCYASLEDIQSQLFLPNNLLI